MKFELKGQTVRLNPRDPHFYNNPYPYYEALRQHTPMFYWEDFDLWCYLNHDDVSALLRDRRFGRQVTHLRTREQLGWPPIRADVLPFYAVDDLSIIQQEPPNHTRLRGLVQKAFMARQIESLRPGIEKFCNSLLDEVEAKGEVDLLPAYATPVPVTVIAQMLGVPTDTTTTNALLGWSHAMVAMYELGRSAGQEHRAVQATQEFVAYLKDIVGQRRKHPQNDLISLMIGAEEHGDTLTEDELVSSCIQLLNAGHEATVNVVGNGVCALLHHREQWDMLARDPSPKLIASAVEEMMRFDPPLHLFTRYVLEDGLTYRGQTYTFGQQVAVLLGAANHDPSRFANANTLDITRPIEHNPHVAFGAGIHFCLGAPLARLELQVAIEVLVRHFPKLQLAEQPQYRDAYHFHGLKSLKVTTK